MKNVVGCSQELASERMHSHGVISQVPWPSSRNERGTRGTAQLRTWFTVWDQ